MQPILEQVLGAGALLLLASLAGYAPARLWLPESLRRWFWLTVPPLGLATLAVTLGWLNSWLPLTEAVWLVLGASLLADVLVLRRLGLAPAERSRTESYAVVALTALAFCVALLPLWDHPDLLSIGPNWDIEIHLPLSAYLTSYPSGFSLSNPAGDPFPAHPNPLLWRVNFFDVRWAGLAFTQWLGTAGALLDRGPHQSFVGVLALLHALSIPSAFLLFRSAGGLTSRFALAAAAALAVNTAALWIVFWSFGQQASALPLLPLALLLSWQALRSPGLGSAILAGLTLAALLAAFAPLALLYGLALAAFGIVAFATASDKFGTIRSLAGIGAISVVLAPWAYLRGIQRFLHGLQEGGVAGLTQGPDITLFPALLWVAGISPDQESGLGGFLGSAAPWDGPASTLFTLALFGLLAVGTYRGVKDRQWPLALAGLALAVLLLTLRYGDPYPYGYQKLMASGGFLFIGLFFLGAQALWQARNRLPQHSAVGLSAAAVLFVGLNLASVPQFIGGIRDDSVMSYRPLHVLEEIIPPDAAVYISGHRDYQGPESGALAYFLRHADLYGHIETGFSSFFRRNPAGTYQYAVYHESEGAPAELFPPENIVWEGSGLSVYKAPDDLRYAQLAGDAATPPVIERSAGMGNAGGLRLTEWREDGAPVFEGWSPPLLGVLADVTPPQDNYPEAKSGQDWASDLTVPGAAPTQSLPSGNLVVTLATFTAQEVTLLVGQDTHHLSVPEGVSTHTVSQMQLPVQLTLRNETDTPVYLRSALVREATPDPPQFTHSNAVLLQWQAAMDGESIALDLRYSGPSQKATLDIYAPADGHHLGWWELPAAQDNSRVYGVRFQPAVPTMDILERSRWVSLPGWRGEPLPGSYRLYFLLWESDKIVRSVSLLGFGLEAETQVELHAGAAGLSIH